MAQEVIALVRMLPVNLVLEVLKGEAVPTT